MTSTTGPVEKAVRSDLRRLGVSVQTSGLAAAAVRLARLLDAPDTSASGGASAARELRTVIGELSSLSAPTRLLTAAAADTTPPPAPTRLEQIRAERERRRAGGG